MYIIEFFYVRFWKPNDLDKILYSLERENNVADH